jgi:DNA-binding MarR family transcriptional regulator
MGLEPRPLNTRVGYLLNRIALQIRQMAQEALKPLGMIPPHMAVLSTILAKGPQTQRGIGKLLKIDPTTMVWLIDDLEKKRLVRRGKHPEDRRAHLVELGPAGTAAFHRAARRLAQMEDHFLAPLSKKERDHLKRILTKLYWHVPTQGISPALFKDTQ